MLFLLLFTLYYFVVVVVPEELDAWLAAALDVVGRGQGGPLVQQDSDYLVVVLNTAGQP